MTVAQTLLDQTDGANWAFAAAVQKPILHNQVIGDVLVPDEVPGSPLAGSEAMNLLMGLQDFDSTLSDQGGVRAVSRFLPPAEHWSLLLPTQPQVTAEMQGQMGSFIAEGGILVQVGNGDLLEPVEVVPAAKVRKDQGKEPGRKAMPRTKSERRFRD
jgi:hypothetical protein